MELPPPDAFVVFGIIGVTLVLFVSEIIPNDITAIGVIFVLGALAPTLGLERADAVSGFSNTATVTIVAMYMLSEGVQKTGLVRLLGVRLAEFTRGDERRALAATVGTTGPLAGFVNNTPIVAVFIPMVTDLAKRAGVSPSKLLLPLSYAAILGGTLTLIGTATNLLASDFARQLIDGRDGIGMFEFTPIGAVILVVGITYLMTVGRRLTPARIPPDADLVEEFGLEDHLARISVPKDSPLVGLSVDEIDERIRADVTVLQIIRGEDRFVAPYTDQTVQAGDRLTVHGTGRAVETFRERHEVRHLKRAQITEEGFLTNNTTLAKFVVPDESPYAGETVEETLVKERHDTTVLAVRRGDSLFRAGIDDFVLEPGDTLLAQTDADAVGYFAESGKLFVAEASVTVEEENVSLSPKTPIAVGTLAAVVGVAALGWLPVVIAALGGVFVMVTTGCLSSSDAYDAVSWNIIFLLAGVIPLGLAMEATGGAAFIAELVVATDVFLPAVGVLLLFYVLTGLFSNVITPVATVVLMIPVAVDAAGRIGANEFSFLLGVTFAAATSFMTPVGYQTNLMVYGPGGYRFSDFVRVGAPLQMLLAVVTTAGITVIWGI
ncbi:MAG: SLC13 family permease [Halobacteriales archaeon]|nr:SLC13 family permease [Halobacteriales archaeon]